MTDRLLPYYNSELSFIRRLATEFARDHPDVASHLRMRQGASDDPHVARLIEAFAYLTARIRSKLDDEFPELTDALLNVLYPHYLAPIPSMAVIQLELDYSQGELSTGYQISKGAEVSVSDASGISCRYRTGYDVTLWPVDVAACELLRRPFSSPSVSCARDAAAILRLRLRCVSDTMTFGQLDSDAFRALRVFLAGEDHHTMPLYELLVNDCTQVAVATSASDATPLSLSPDRVQPVGFAPEHCLLPYDARAFAGYGLLTDYFAFPQKFLFLDLCGLGEHPRAEEANELEVYFFLRKAAPDLESYITKDSVRLGCVPIVNLFQKRAEPIKLTQRMFEHPVIPDARRRREVEVYSVDRVTTTTANGDTTEYSPLYAVRQEGTFSAARRFWESHRRDAAYLQGKRVKGTDVWLSLVDLDLSTAAPADQTLIIQTTCFNRDLPGEISRPSVRLLEGAPIRESIDCLVGPTATCRPSHRQKGMWSLVSHLTLGQLSITDVAGSEGSEDAKGAAALKRILELYDFRHDNAVRKRIDGIVLVSSRPTVCRLASAPSGFARGVDVLLEFDAEHFRDPGQGVFLFASVLECFFSLYCSINSFSRTTARFKQGEKVIKQWPANAGEKFLL